MAAANRLWRKAFFVLLTLGALAGAVIGGNYAAVHRYLEGVIAADSRNTGVAARAYYGHLVDPSTLVLDIRSISGTNSIADVFRVILQFASAMQDKTFKRVELAFRGDTRFVLDGAYFKQLGMEFQTQNPIYTMRTFSENLLRPDGSRAFGTWTGGLLGVLSRQVEDFNEFHRQWYLKDLVQAHQ